MVLKQAPARPLDGAGARQVPHDLLLVLGWALGLRLLFAALVGGTYDPDEFVILALSRDFAHGSVPYHDFLFFHPPGILVLFRAVQPLVAWWWPSGRILTLLIDTGTAGLVWWIGRDLYGRAGGLAAGLVYGASPLALVCSVRIGQDPIITALGMAGLTLLLSTRGRMQVAGAIGAGVCLGVAIWVKYPAVLFLPAYILIAPRRSLICLSSLAATLLAAFAPFLWQAHALWQQTVTWQLLDRPPTALVTRMATVGAFWLLVNPLTAISLTRYRPPAWLLSGFAVGAVFLFASQVYYHYFLPVAPFGALIGAPLAARIFRHWPRLVAAGGALLTCMWGANIAMGNGPSRLFVTAIHFSSIRRTVRLLDEITRPGDRILTDQLEYAYLADRPSLADYFWNARSVVHAQYLERHLDDVKAVVLTERVAPTYPPGFTNYLRTRRYASVQTRTTEVWLTSRPGGGRTAGLLTLRADHGAGTEAADRDWLADLVETKGAPATHQ